MEDDDDLKTENEEMLDAYEDEDDDEDDEVEIIEPELSHADHKENGNKSYKQKDYRAAIAHYTLAISSFTESEDDPLSTLASYYSNRAAAFSMILQYDKVLDDCDFAITTDPTFTKAFFRKARTLTILGRCDEAVKAYSLGMVRDPNNAVGVKDKEEVQQLHKRFRLAKEIFRAKENTKVTRKDAVQVLRQMELVLATCTQFKDAMYFKAWALFWLHRTDEAYALTTTLVRMGGLGDDEQHALVLLRAKLLYCMGNTDDALKHLRQMLAGDPDNKVAFGLLKGIKGLAKKKQAADQAYKSRQYELAVEHYGEALELCATLAQEHKLEAPSYTAKLYFNRASAQAARRQHAQVVKDCGAAIKLDSNYLKAYARRASSHLLIGEEADCNQAIRDYETAASLTKDNPDQQRDFQKKIRAAQVQLKRSKRKDFYKVLGVARDANDAEVRKCYRKLALKWHPDRHATSTEEQKKQAETTFRDVNLAYEVLSDPVKKQKYDDGVDEQDLDNPHASAGGGGHGGMDPNMFFEMFMRQQSGGMGGGGGGGRRRGGGRGGQSYHFG